MVVLCDQKTTSSTNAGRTIISSRPSTNEVSDTLPAYTPSSVTVDPLLLIAIVFSMSLCIAAFILSLFDGGSASVYLNLFSPIPILFHHVLLTMDELKIHHSHLFMGQGKLFTERHDLSRWLFYNSLFTAFGSIIAFTQCRDRWGWRGTVFAQGIVQLVHVVILWYILWRAYAMRSAMHSIPITLPNGSSMTIRFIKFSRKPLFNESLPVSPWMLLHSLEVAVIIFILAVNHDSWHKCHPVNTIASVLTIFHHLTFALVFLDKRPPLGQSTTNVEPRPLLPFIRRRARGEPYDSQTSFIIIMSLLQLLAMSIAGAVLAGELASTSGNALAITLFQTLQCILFAVLILGVLAKSDWYWQGPEAGEGVHTETHDIDRSTAV